MTIESRCQRSALCEQLFLGRCPKLRLNAALLALNRYERKVYTVVRLTIAELAMIGVDHKHSV